MLSESTPFSATEKEYLDVVKKNMARSLQLLEKNPTHFDVILDYIDQHKKTMDSIKYITEPHKQKYEKAYTEQYSSFFEFFKNQARETYIKEKVIASKIHDYVYTAIQETEDRIIGKEPRITKRYPSNTWFGDQRDRWLEYNIQFSDGFVLTIYPEKKKIDAARVVFSKKLEELAVKNQPLLRS